MRCASSGSCRRRSRSAAAPSAWRRGSPWRTTTWGCCPPAEASCQAALAVAPASADALNLLGELCADRGRFAEAQDLFLRAISVAPEFVPAYGSIAAHRRMTSADGAWLKGAESLLAKPLLL